MYHIYWIADFISCEPCKLIEAFWIQTFHKHVEYGVLLVYDHLPKNLDVECMMSTSCHLALNYRDVGWWPHSNVCCDWLESRCNLWKADPHHDSIFVESWNLHFVPYIKRVWNRKNNWRCKDVNQNVVFASTWNNMIYCFLTFE